ncbi:DNA-processing protein DprA [Psychrobium sp. 1_MG-2023]|uniref:DNA-processing protein DprA n=1 Tax=Psychrobium sp. 1_MG-2023 TaxID=3062624 RepID=UPI000C31E107|nr:DNA-processing protein DprA [Psychrobium sp. 1_MG-2023]MDP2560395.1 DNA-processing protein DprA [Psychrobium sp. 1_MG-2023]PKF57936.1 DNA-protecting protein DprA [Alteromonadales bacterium alter-6D02]
MDRTTQLLILDSLPQLGVYRLEQKLRGCSPFDLFTLSKAELAKLGFNNKQIDHLTKPPLNKLSAVYQWLAQDNLNKIISYYDDDYPVLLKEIGSPPLLLFCRGDCRLLSDKQISIVGSRAATISGRESAKRFAYELVGAGFTVTSGLAAGIDSYAHQGALAANGKTIAVLGSGLNNIYPKTNQGLAKQIEQQGLLVSEFWPDVPPLAPQFPRRNRIVSGLSLGVVVVEAANRSGSLITARLAVEQNREVFAVPGSINNPKVSGCHKLINQGAKLIATTADILDELPVNSLSQVAQQHKNVDRLASQAQFPFDIVLDNIGFEVTSVDQIVLRTEITIDKVLERLLHLELSGFITSVSGGYIRIKGDT